MFCRRPAKKLLMTFCHQQCTNTSYIDSLRVMPAYKSLLALVAASRLVNFKASQSST